MKPIQQDPRTALAKAVSGLKQENPQAEAMQSASERVWKHLEQANGADQFLAPQTSAAPPRPWKDALPRGGFGGLQWAVALAVVLALGISGYFVQRIFFSGPAGMRASVISFEGAVYRVGFSGEQALRAGDEISEGEQVRTAGESRALLRLRDGSVVEMNERAQLGVSMGRRDTTIRLDRGDIIVQAAKRKSGHLYVAAKDCRVAVTGTVFSVNSGLKGSRVSVIEGEVRVSEDGATRILHPGDQLSTSTALAAVPVKQEIAWSQNLDKHLALLAEFSKLQKKLETVRLPDLRYQSTLLPLLPSNTVLYAALPNLGDAVQQANQLFQQQLQESPVLKDWWQKVQSQKGAPDFNQVIDEIHNFSQYLGDEIVLSINLDGRRASPLAVAHVQRAGLKEFIEQEYSKHADASHPKDMVVLDESQLNSSKADAHKQALFMLVGSDFVAAAPNLAELRQFDAALKQGSGGFADTDFGHRMQAEYQDGAGILIGANLHAMAAEHEYAHPARNPQAFASTGFGDVQYLVAERKDSGAMPLNRAELTFTGQRRGVTSWLAQPAPIGGLEFVSKNAGMAGALVSKSPAQILDDVLSIAGASDPKAQTEVAQTESELNIRLHQDLADTLGGEITFALDGPILPTPSWKLVLEVYNPGRLQSTIEQLIADANQKSRNGQITLEQQAADGLAYYRVRLPGRTAAAEVDYTFADGYMVIAPSRALVRNAVAVHRSGDGLSRSAEFQALLPQDEHANASALLYQNLSPVLGPVIAQLSPSQVQSLQQIAADNKPTVICAYGEPNAIRVASNSKAFGINLNAAALSTLMQLARPQGTRRE
ncbi:MAG TPA: FecR domain-containing protein [Terriglobales bacterium]|nr:FecR domain-containing protein [Terriglobales bacterium]